MKHQRYFILTQPTLDPESRFLNFCETPNQKAKDKENIQLLKKNQISPCEGIPPQQQNYLQNEGLSHSTPNFGSQQNHNQEERQKFHKFQIIENINQFKDNDQKKGRDSVKKNLLKKQSTTKCIYQKIHTQIISQIQKKDEFLTGNGIQRKSTKRKKCRIRSKEEYEMECQYFLMKKERQEVDDLFRHVNREMKLSQKRKEGNNFYQKIRKNAIKKIDYMSYNQKYYDNSEVKHLNSVVQNCNILIHKRDCKIDAKPLYQTLKHRQFTEYKNNFVNDTEQIVHKSPNMERQSQKKGHLKNKASIGKGLLQQTEKQSVFSEFNTTKQLNKGSQQSSRRKTEKLKQQTYILTSRMNNIVHSCSQQQLKMKQVKKGMKIFQFYCNKLEEGFNSRQNKLNNFLKWEEIDQ